MKIHNNLLMHRILRAENNVIEIASCTGTLESKVLTREIPWRHSADNLENVLRSPVGTLCIAPPL
ncbi:MAG TPA: hypothetical protein VFN53_11495 [Acidobacteriaceae bacterium]|nr:hypothetical protein [Acidobacteriaceae bacterium]